MGGLKDQPRILRILEICGAIIAVGAAIFMEIWTRV